jgi:hypothetical protein
VSLIPEQRNPKRKTVTVKYYLTKEEAAEFEQTAFILYIHKVIPRHTLGAFAKAAGYKWFNEINQHKTTRESMSKGDKTFSTTSQDKM